MEVNSQAEGLLVCKTDLLASQLTYENSQWIFLVVVGDQKFLIVDQGVVDVHNVADCCRDIRILDLDTGIEKLLNEDEFKVVRLETALIKQCVTDLFTEVDSRQMLYG